MISDLTAVPEVGKTYLGKVVRLAEFGAFVEIFPGTDGLLHISEVAEHRVKDVKDELEEGDQIMVKVLSMEGNRIKLSRKAVIKEQRAKMGLPASEGAEQSGGEEEGRGRGDRRERGERSERPQREERPQRPAEPAPQEATGDTITVGDDDFEEDFEDGDDEGDFEEAEGGEETAGTTAPVAAGNGQPQQPGGGNKRRRRRGGRGRRPGGNGGNR